MLHVTAAVICSDGCVLITRRRQGQQMEGLWEFPGGKMEAGETQEEALAREIREELGVEITRLTKLCDTPYDYPRGSICLHVFVCRISQGDIALTDHDAMAWVRPEELRNYELAPADLEAAALLAEGRVSVV